VRIRHVASMASGHTREMLAEAIARDTEEPVRGFLLIPPDRDPGTVFAYSQPCTYALASIIQRNAGMPLTRYLRPRLFDPLGIGPVGWHTFPPGREQGFSGLHGDTIPVAASGGWLDGDTLRAEVIFLETPHRMDITCSRPGRTAEAVWRHPPLAPSSGDPAERPASRRGQPAAARGKLAQGPRPGRTAAGPGGAARSRPDRRPAAAAQLAAA
jgi:CubicO group peptidase (beta-lactamase class C family)